MPRRVWQVSTERIFTSSMPASSIMLDLVLVDLLVRCDEHLAGVRIDDVLERDAAEDAVAELLDDLAALDERRRSRCRRCVPQSNSVMIASCATSTRRRVR